MQVISKKLATKVVLLPQTLISREGKGALPVTPVNDDAQYQNTTNVKIASTVLYNGVSVLRAQNGERQKKSTQV